MWLLCLNHVKMSLFLRIVQNILYNKPLWLSPILSLSTSSLGIFLRKKKLQHYVASHWIIIYSLSSTQSLNHNLTLISGRTKHSAPFVWGTFHDFGEYWLQYIFKRNRIQWLLLYTVSEQWPWNSKSPRPLSKKQVPVQNLSCWTSWGQETMMKS